MLASYHHYLNVDYRSLILGCINPHAYVKKLYQDRVT